MTRDELAARIYINGSTDAEEAFYRADHFLAEAKRQMSSPCKHEFAVYSQKTGTQCLKCRQIVEPAKPEKKAREFNLYQYENRVIACTTKLGDQYPGREDGPIFLCKVREVLE